MSFGRTLYKLGFEISPIILTNGVADGIPGGMLPIVAITEAANFVLGLLHGNIDLDLDQYFAHFRPLPGATLVDNQIGQYPFANQTVAANAIIAQPKVVSLQMSCPVRNKGGYASKLMTVEALIKVLEKHNNSGGTYTIATPSYIYTNCIMTGLRDVSPGASKQAQTDWQFDFKQPLIALEDAQTVMNSLMDKIANGLPQIGEPSWSGLASTIGDTLSGAAASVVTTASNLVGTAVSGAQSTIGGAIGGVQSAVSGVQSAIGSISDITIGE